ILDNPDKFDLLNIFLATQDLTLNFLNIKIEAFSDHISHMEIHIRPTEHFSGPRVLDFYTHLLTPSDYT
ncbi:MAG: hypothetical protein ACRC2N_02890, partial [Aeromonas sp.]